MDRRREKVFGPPIGAPIDRNEKARIMMRARAIRAGERRARQHGGPISHAALEVLYALLTFAHRRTGACFPSYEAIAARARVARSTVARAIRALEAHGLIGWVHRLWKARVTEEGLRGPVRRWRVTRTSNSYVFPQVAATAAGIEGRCPGSSKSDHGPGSGIQSLQRLATRRPSHWPDSMRSLWLAGFQQPPNGAAPVV